MMNKVDHILSVDVTSDLIGLSTLPPFERCRQHTTRITAIARCAAPTR